MESFPETSFPNKIQEKTQYIYTYIGQGTPFRIKPQRIDLKVLYMQQRNFTHKHM